MVLVFGVVLLATGAADAATIQLAWDPASDDGTIGYVVCYGTESATYSYCVNVADATSFDVRGLSTATAYHFAVQAYNAAGEFSERAEQRSNRRGTLRC